jgi:hypothetical protein
MSLKIELTFESMIVARHWGESSGLLNVMVHACNPSTQKAEAGGFQVQGQPGLLGRRLLRRRRKERKERKEGERGRQRERKERKKREKERIQAL